MTPRFIDQICARAGEILLEWSRTKAEPSSRVGAAGYFRLAEINGYREPLRPQSFKHLPESLAPVMILLVKVCQLRERYMSRSQARHGLYYNSKIAPCVVLNVIPLLSGHCVDNGLIDYAPVENNITYVSNDHQNDTQPYGHPVEIRSVNLDINDRNGNSTYKSRAID
jgi:hypothetical protein